MHEASVGFAGRGMISHINDEDILRKFTEGEEEAAITNAPMGDLFFKESNSSRHHIHHKQYWLL